MARRYSALLTMCLSLVATGAAAQLVDDARTPEAAAPWDLRPQDSIRAEGFTDDSRGLLGRCQDGALDACLELARRFHGGREVPRDNELAVRLFGWSCEAGEPMACVELGGRYYMGYDVPTDLEMALELLERGCAGGVADACLVAGRMYRDGIGSARDRDEAGALLERGCELGLATACAERGLATRPGRYEAALPDSASAGLRETARSCDHGVQEECHELAATYRAGEVVPRDLERAEHLDEEACEWGHLGACEALGR